MVKQYYNWNKLTIYYNCDTVIKVQTPVGYTDCRETSENVGQGTNEGAIILSVNLSGAIARKFKGSVNEVCTQHTCLHFLKINNDTNLK